jgi:hypothetical protein
MRPGVATPPSLPPKQKQAYVRTLQKRLERLGEPIHIKFDISTLDGVLRLQKDVIRLVFDRKLGPADARSLNEAIRNLLGVMRPVELEAKIDAIANELRTRGEILDNLQRAAKAGESSRRAGKAEAN